MKENILIAGLGGCVGHYLYDILADDPSYEIFAFVRNPQKLLFDPNKAKNIHFIRDDILNIAKYPDIARSTDHLINLTADWGSEKGNLAYNVNLFEAMDLNRCKKVFYFSTASILGEANLPSHEVESVGTPYIRGKYLMHKKLKEMKIADRTTVLFPTWVLGGDEKHPYSHAYSAMKGASKWMWLLRFFKLDLKFHFIHAMDIAAITVHLLKSGPSRGELVLGNPAITADELLEAVCRKLGVKRRPVLSIGETALSTLSNVLNKRLSPWDKYSIQKRNQTFDTVNAGTYGLPSKFDTIGKIMDDLFGGQ